MLKAGGQAGPRPCIDAYNTLLVAFLDELSLFSTAVMLFSGTMLGSSRLSWCRHTFRHIQSSSQGICPNNFLSSTWLNNFYAHASGRYPDQQVTVLQMSHLHPIRPVSDLNLPWWESFWSVTICLTVCFFFYCCNIMFSHC